MEAAPKYLSWQALCCPSSKDHSKGLASPASLSYLWNVGHSYFTSFLTCRVAADLDRYQRTCVNVKLGRHAFCFAAWAPWVCGSFNFGTFGQLIHRSCELQNYGLNWQSSRPTRSKSIEQDTHPSGAKIDLSLIVAHFKSYRCAIADECCQKICITFPTCLAVKIKCFSSFGAAWNSVRDMDCFELQELLPSFVWPSFEGTRVILEETLTGWVLIYLLLITQLVKIPYFKFSLHQNLQHASWHALGKLKVPCISSGSSRTKFPWAPPQTQVFFSFFILPAASLSLPVTSSIASLWLIKAL